MASTLGSSADGSNGIQAIAAPAEISRTEALSLLRLLSPQGNDRTYFSTSVLSTPNGGQLYVTPNLYG